MIRIFGNSDDQVYVEQDGKRCQLDVKGDEVVIGVGLNASPAAGCFVTMHYGVGCSIAVWTATVAQIDENILIPWLIRIENAKLEEQVGWIHSVAVVIECPPGTPWEIVAEEVGA
jgi:hypothetical protein